MKIRNLVFYILISLILYYVLILWGVLLVNNNYIHEKFQPNVDVPLTSKYSCSNFCGPNAECAFSREQCSTDYDCQGCKPKQKKDYTYQSKDVPGDDDAGKMTFSQTPQYSSLTNDFGTRSSIIMSKTDSVPQLNLGVDTWTKSFNQGMNYYLKSQIDNEKELNYDFEFEQHYPTTESITGLFVTSDIPASNSDL
jgi:hypothetical protein